MKSKKNYLRVATKIGYILLTVVLFIIAGGIYQGYNEAHDLDNELKHEAQRQ